MRKGIVILVLIIIYLVIHFLKVYQQFTRQITNNIAKKCSHSVYDGWVNRQQVLEIFYDRACHQKMVAIYFVEHQADAEVRMIHHD